MQEVLQDDSTGKTFVENTIEDLVPHIKKSLEDPNVKYVKVFRAKALGKEPFEEKDEFIVEEEKCNVIEQIIEDDKKEKKKAPFPYLKRS